jgi:D-3-phosphoglycerate dehydrogenase
MTHPLIGLPQQKSALKAVLLEGIHPSAIETLKRDGYRNVVTHAKALAGEELIAAIRGAHFVGIRSRTQLTAEVLQHADQLAAIGCCCIGTNQPRCAWAFRSSTHRSPTPAASPSWCWRRSSC